MSLGEDVILEFAQPYTVTRSAAPAIVNGRAQPPVTSDVVIRASIQPSGGRDLLLLEEGLRTREAISIYTPDDVYGLSDAARTPADVITYGGERYQIQTVRDWRAAAGYVKAIAIKIPR